MSRKPKENEQKKSTWMGAFGNSIPTPKLSWKKINTGLYFGMTFRNKRDF